MLEGIFIAVVILFAVAYLVRKAVERRRGGGCGGGCGCSSSEVAKRLKH